MVGPYQVAAEALGGECSDWRTLESSGRGGRKWGGAYEERPRGPWQESYQRVRGGRCMNLTLCLAPSRTRGAYLAVWRCGSYHEKGEDFRFEAVTWLGAQGTTTPSDPRRRRESQLRAHRSPPQAPPTAPLRCFRAIH